jgi:quinolinate synthase
MVEVAEYKQLTLDQVAERIRAAKAELGNEVVILGHHYVSDEVIQFADYRGDSLQLSRQAANVPDARYIVFCGVHFMAETAAVLSRDEQIVLVPTTRASCMMAEMADIEEVSAAWDDLDGLWPGDVTPITYVNSTARLKAFCGRHDGISCTSSNAADIVQWALARKDHVFFFPDENLGTNVALSLGIPREQIKVWNPSQPWGGNPTDIDKARVIVWRGFCYVHTQFAVEHVEAIRAKYDDIQVIVHPECTPEVVQAADANGSTSFIIQMVEKAPEGARIAVGTEANLVHRLNAQYPKKLVIPLAESHCVAMGRNNVYNLLHALESILAGQPVAQVQVSPEIREYAKIAVERMLQES